VISLSAEFDPATSTRAFTVALSDVGELALLPLVLGAFAIARASLRDSIRLGPAGTARPQA
jgi:hypothetical protein